MPPISVSSEIGALRGVLVHTPGRELEAVTPGNREDFLYDDLIGLEVSVREHARLKAVLCRFAAVHEIGDLLVRRPDDLRGRRRHGRTRARTDRSRTATCRPKSPRR